MESVVRIDRRRAGRQAGLAERHRVLDVLSSQSAIRNQQSEIENRHDHRSGTTTTPASLPVNVPRSRASWPLTIV